MSFLIIVFFLFLVFIVQKKRSLDSISKKIMSFYIIEWWYVILFSRFQLYGMRPIDSWVSWLLIMHVITFLMGFVIYAKSKKIKSTISIASNYSIESEIKRFLSNKWFIGILIFTTIYVLGKFAVFYQQVVIMNAIGDLRDAYYEGDMYGSEFEMVQGFLLVPMNLICSILWSYSLLRQRDWVFIVMTVFLFANNILVGGRIGYVLILFSLVLVVFLCKINIRKNILMLVGILVGIYFVFSFLTAARLGGSSELSYSNISNNGFEETNKAIITYSTGPVAAFNVSVNEDFTSQIGGHKHGALVGASFVHLAYIVMNKLGMPFRQPFLDYSERIQDDYINIGSGQWNALYTSANFYYLDSGVIGVLLYPFIFGIIFCWILNVFGQTQSIWHLFLLGYVWQLVCCSIMNYRFTSAFVLIMVFVLYYLGNRKKRGLNYSGKRL